MGKIASGWPCVPAGAESLLVQPLLPFSGGGDGSSSGGTARGVLVLLSERPRALSSKERAWGGGGGGKASRRAAGLTCRLPACVKCCSQVLLDGPVKK